ADYQGTRQLVARPRISTVPTLANRQGNFSSSLGALLFLTPAGAVTAVSTGNTPIMVTGTDGNQIQARQNQIFRPADKRAYVNNTIPLADFDATARLLLNRFPLPTTSGAANNFTRIGNETLNSDQFDVRFDHNLSKTGRFFGRYSYEKDFADPVVPPHDGSGANSNAAGGNTDTAANALVLNYAQAFLDGKINELRFGYTARKVDRASTALVGSDSAVLRGVPSTAQFTDTLPTYLIAG